MENPLWFKSDWINPFNKETHYNWIDFAFVHLSFELDNRFGNFEFHAALLGFHIGGSWKVTEGDLELQAKLDKMMKELDSGDVHISIPLKEYNALRGIE